MFSYNPVVCMKMKDYIQFKYPIPTPLEIMLMMALMLATLSSCSACFNCKARETTVCKSLKKKWTRPLQFACPFLKLILGGP